MQKKSPKSSEKHLNHAGFDPKIREIFYRLRGLF